jgi:hypothetical protein
MANLRNIGTGRKMIEKVMAQQKSGPVKSTKQPDLKPTPAHTGSKTPRSKFTART